MQLAFKEEVYRGVLPRAPRKPEPDQPAQGDTRSSIRALRKKSEDALDAIVLRAIEGISSDDELGDVIDTLLTDKEYLDARRDLRELGSFESALEAVANPKSFSPSKFFVDLTSDVDVKLDILNAGLLVTQTEICTLQFLIHQASTEQPEEESSQPEEGSSVSKTILTPLWFMSVHGMPVEYKRSFLGREVVDICVDILWALQRNSAQGIAVPEWLVAALAKRWRSGGYQYLRLVASLPGAAASPDVISPEDVLGASVLQTAQQAEQGYKVRLREAHARDGLAASLGDDK